MLTPPVICGVHNTVLYQLGTCGAVVRHHKCNQSKISTHKMYYSNTNEWFLSMLCSKVSDQPALPTSFKSPVEDGRSNFLNMLTFCNPIFHGICLTPYICRFRAVFRPIPMYHSHTLLAPSLLSSWGMNARRQTPKETVASSKHQSPTVN